MNKLVVDDVQIAYDDEGAGPTVVLLHGYPFNRSLWADQVAALRSDFRVITPDLRGHGDSSVGAPGINRMARDIAGLLDLLGVARAIIGGLSMGGYVTLAFYRQFPDRAKGLILADTRPQADTEENKKVRAAQANTILAEGMIPIADAMLPKLLHGDTLTARPEVVKRLRDMIEQTNPKGAVAALDGMANREDQTGLLKLIQVPTLILVGKDDPITPLADSQLMHQRIEGSQLVVFENTCHVSNLERPGEFNQALSSFLRDVKA